LRLRLNRRFKNRINIKQAQEQQSDYRYRNVPFHFSILPVVIVFDRGYDRF
jgi:hypothetical protein